jgi:hypothetical protein
MKSCWGCRVRKGSGWIKAARKQGYAERKHSAMYASKREPDRGMHNTVIELILILEAHR